MSTEEKTVETKVTQESVNLDEIFNAAPGADTAILPEDSKPGFFESLFFNTLLVFILMMKVWLKSYRATLLRLILSISA